MKRSDVLLLAAVSLALGCSGGERSDPETLRLGRQVYGGEGCAACHGSDLRGAQMGPPLTRLSRHWDAASLERFLVEPDTVIATSSRLQKLDDRYPADMPGVLNRDTERTQALVAFLLDQ